MTPTVFALALLGIMATPLAASNVVVSNLSQTAGGNAALQDSQGMPLAAGSFVQAGSFSGKTAAELAALANDGAVALMAEFTPFGTAVTVGTGSGGTAGTIEFTASAPISAEIPESLHVVVFNASNPAEATECLILGIGEAPLDDPSGLPGYLAVHLRETTLVFGTRTASGFATRGEAVTGGFETWIATQTGSGTNLLPDEDADSDGVANLVEYAFGSAAGEGSSRASLEIVKLGEAFAAEYLRRNDDPALVMFCETGTNPSSGTWLPLESPVVALAEDPRPVPAGYERVRQSLPGVPDRLFARLRVSR
jgi:hypothetical protein